MIPLSTPQLALAKVQEIILKHGVKDPVIVVAIRGYYRDTMGKPGANDRGIYDDAMFIVSARHFSSWNANTDPSVHRPGIASLMPGVHRYKRGNHGISRPGGGYPAFRPATRDEALPVSRDGIKDPKPGVAINIHKGSRNSTSSEGCQTLPPHQWDAFYSTLDRELREHKQSSFPYILTE